MAWRRKDSTYAFPTGALAGFQRGIGSTAGNKCFSQMALVETVALVGVLVIFRHVAGPIRSGTFVFVVSASGALPHRWVLVAKDDFGGRVGWGSA